MSDFKMPGTHQELIPVVSLSRLMKDKGKRKLLSIFISLLLLLSFSIFRNNHIHAWALES